MNKKSKLKIYCIIARGYAPDYTEAHNQKEALQRLNLKKSQVEKIIIEKY